ncbi:hypothetical protein C8R48DRAFT_604217 [Suillus tomentosus]|nr:hypothetical protein C8R48DRAFT_604217 [Suillus tomentosus]
MLIILERSGSSFLRLADSCLGQERRENPSRTRSRTTWENDTASAMSCRVRTRSHSLSA